MLGVGHRKNRTAGANSPNPARTVAALSSTVRFELGVAFPPGRRRLEVSLRRLVLHPPLNSAVFSSKAARHLDLQHPCATPPRDGETYGDAHGPVQDSFETQTRPLKRKPAHALPVASARPDQNGSERGNLSNGRCGALPASRTRTAQAPRRPTTTQGFFVIARWCLRRPTVPGLPRGQFSAPLAL